MYRNSVLIFTKIPLAGFVKTRLLSTSCLTENEVELLAEAMLKDTLAIASESDSDKIELGYTPKKNFSKLTNIVETVRSEGMLTRDVDYYLQKGHNFDERFSSTVSSSFNNDTEQLIVLGSDLPYLDPKIINYAFDQLSKARKRQQIVIGPASGGGIYLVGLSRSFNPNWFTKYELFTGGIETSQFIKLCRMKDLELILLPQLADIDLEEDLVSLISLIDALSIANDREFYHFPKYTAKVMDDIGVYIEEILGETRRRKIRKRKLE